MFEKHHSLIYRAAYSVTGNGYDAEDALQIVFLKMIKGEPSSDFRKIPVDTSIGRRSMRL